MIGSRVGNYDITAKLGGRNAETRALVMELVEGPTLAEFLAAATLSLEESLPIAIEIVQAHTAAHNQGIVHRDLKPQNIKLATGGRVKVLDFVLAPRRDHVCPGHEGRDHSRRSRVHGAGAGAGRAGDTGADIFSSGCVLYELVTGERALFRSNAIETLATGQLSAAGG